MITFEVNDMTCGHCVGAITRALQAADPAAQVSIDLALHRVMVEPAASNAQALQQAISEAGYTPNPIEVAPAPAAPTATGGGCCSRGG